MGLTDIRLKELSDPALDAGERALRRCRLAAELLDEGDEGGARVALGPLWVGVGVPPTVGDLGEAVAADALLQVGLLSAQSGGAGLETASALIGESVVLFGRLGPRVRLSEARAALAECRRRARRYDEARSLAREAVAGAGDDRGARAKGLLVAVTIECSAWHLTDALRLLVEAEPLVEAEGDGALGGSFRRERARYWRRVAEAEGRADCREWAITDYEESARLLRGCRRERRAARAEHELALLLCEMGRHAEAHERLDRAQAAFTAIRDGDGLAENDSARARVLAAEKRYREADRAAARALQTLERETTTAALAEALSALGVIRARLGLFEDSIRTLMRAAEVAEAAGEPRLAGHCLLDFIEEHCVRRSVPADEVEAAYVRAEGLLAGERGESDRGRLFGCAGLLLRRLSVTRFDDPNFSLYSAVHEFEARLIGRALEASGGSVTHAARLLGLKHQTLGSMLGKRHRGLAGKRTPPERRLRSIVKEPEKD